MEDNNWMTNADLNAHFEQMRLYVLKCKTIEEIVEYIVAVQKTLEKPTGNADTKTVG